MPGHARYHDLRHVEKAFRMAKSDLATRPILHLDAEAVCMLCLVTLAMARAMDLAGGRFLRQVIDARLFRPY